MSGLQRGSESACASVQDECRNRHPSDAKGGGQPVAAQRSSSKKDRAAAWRAHNAAMQGYQSASVGKQLASPESQLCSSHAPQPAPDELKGSRMGSRSHLHLALRPGYGTPPQLPSTHRGSVISATQCPSVPGADPAHSTAGGAVAEDNLQGPAKFTSAPARKRLSYARLGPAGGSPAEIAGSASRSAQSGAGLKRFKIRNRFRAGVFRRCQHAPVCNCYRPQQPVWPHLYPSTLPALQGMMRNVAWV